MERRPRSAIERTLLVVAHCAGVSHAMQSSCRLQRACGPWWTMVGAAAAAADRNQSNQFNSIGRRWSGCAQCTGWPCVRRVCKAVCRRCEWIGSDAMRVGGRAGRKGWAAAAWDQWQRQRSVSRVDTARRCQPLHASHCTPTPGCHRASHRAPLTHANGNSGRRLATAVTPSRCSHSDEALRGILTPTSRRMHSNQPW